MEPSGEYFFVGSACGILYQVRALDHFILNTYPGGGNHSNPSDIVQTVNNTSPVSFNGCHYMTPTETYNQLSWLPAPVLPVQYVIFRDAALTKIAGTVSGSTLNFNDYNRLPGQTYWYHLVAYYSNQFSLQLGSIEVPPNRICLSGL